MVTRYQTKKGKVKDVVMSKWHHSNGKTTLCGRLIPTVGEREDVEDSNLIDCRQCKKIIENENILLDF